MIDPRLDVIGRRLQKVKRIIAVSSAKGGVGKSVCAALIALAFGRDGRRAGLLDIDVKCSRWPVGLPSVTLGNPEPLTPPG